MISTNLGHTRLKWHTFSSLEECGTAWRDFQQGAIRTAFQRFEWQDAWFRTFGQARHLQPMIAFGTARDRLAIIVPLARDRRFGVRRLTWLAADWCDYAAPLMAPDLAAALSPADVGAIWTSLSRLAGGAACMVLERQPLTIGDCANPFARYRSTDFTAGAHALRLGSEWEPFYASLRSSRTRRKFREKERRLAESGELTFRRLHDQREIRTAVSTLLDWKVAAITARGMVNPFRDTRSDDFLASVLIRAPDFCRFYVLELDRRMLAGGIVLADGDAFLLYQMAYRPGPHAKHSPGYLLVVKIMQEAVAEARRIFDFALGDEAYKRELCDTDLRLTQTALALAPGGWLPFAEHAARTRVKRAVKTSPSLLKTFSMANRLATRLGIVPGHRLPAPEAPAAPAEPATATGLTGLRTRPGD